jgi:hypothetical protein
MELKGGGPETKKTHALLFAFFYFWKKVIQYHLAVKFSTRYQRKNNELVGLRR